MFQKVRSRIGQFSQIFAIRLYGAGAAFVVTLILGRLLGPAEFGAYVYAMSWLSLFLLAATLGFQHFAVRSLPPLIVKEQKRDAKGLVIFAFAATTVLSCVVSALAWTQADRLATEPALQVAVATAALLILPSAWTFLRTGVMQGLGEPVAAQIPDRVVAPTLLLLALAGCLLLSITLSARIVLLMTLAISFASLLFGIASLRAALASIGVPPSFQHTSAWIAGAGKSALAFAAMTALAATDVVMLGLLSTPEETGIYGVAARFFLLMSLPLQAAIAQMSQRIARHHAMGATDELARTACAAANRELLSALALALPSTVAAFYVEAIFGPGFAPATIPMLILIWTRVILAFFGQPGAVLGVTDYVGTLAVSTALTALMNVALNATLIPPLGASGAAIATASSFGLMTLSHIWLLRRKLGVTIFVGRTAS
ncbi:MAG: polysaccharide biosynthesis C-terminal domain-containing protein [Pseudomonadota bacterium]